VKPRYEKVTYTETQSFSVERIVGPVIDCVFHLHPEYELTLVDSSSGMRFVGETIDSFSAGTLSLYGPLLPHHYYSPLSESPTEDWGQVRVVKFKRDFAGASFFDTPELGRIKKMLDDSQGGIDFPKEQAVEKSIPLIDKLFKSQGAARFCLLIELLSCLSQLDYKVISSVPSGAPLPQPDERTNRIIRFIHGRISANKRISQSEAAKEAAMSPAAFCRFFRQSTRKSFVDYVNEVKIERACMKLLSSSDTIAEICYSTGFNNLSNFNRQFFKKKGLQPFRYRKAYQSL